VSRQGRWRRLVGEYLPGQAENEPPPAPLPIIDFQSLRRSLPGQRQAGAGNRRNVDSSFNSAFVDPPVGGLNTNDVLLEIPAYSEQFGTIVAAVAQQSDASLAPGIWDITITMVGGTVASNKRLVWEFLPFAQVTARAVLDGSVGPVGIHFLLGTGTALQKRVQVYIPEEWKLALVVGNALVDAEVFNATWEMQLVHALDALPTIE